VSRSDFQLPDTHCPDCKHKVNAGTCTTQGGLPLGPQGGDIAVCAYCGSVNQYDDEMQLQLLPPTVFYGLDARAQNEILRAVMIVKVYNPAKENEEGQTEGFARYKKARPTHT
jgi:hypothetical protein